MKYAFLLVAFAICLKLNAQQKLNIQYEARYELKFKEFKNQNPEKKINTFILLFNKDESFIKNMNVYVKDSLISNGKIKLTGDDMKDLAINTKYYTDLPYTIYKKGSQINYSTELAGNEYKYTETVEFKWKISRETKIVNGVKCVKATTTKWGRNWIAYYSPKHPMPFGPYKFHGLPGLIFEIHDEGNDYSFSMYRFKKRKESDFRLFNYSKAKLITKKQIEKIRHNYAVAPIEATVDGDPDFQKKMLRYKLDREKNYNPIELTE